MAINGTRYHTGDILVLRCVDDFPEFGEVKEIVIDNEREWRLQSVFCRQSVLTTITIVMTSQTMKNLDWSSKINCLTFTLFVCIICLYLTVQ